MTAIDFNEAKARFEHARARMRRAGFSDREARQLAVRQMFPADPQDGAAAEFIERMGPVHVSPADVVRHEAWWQHETIIPRWLPVLVEERNEGRWQARRRPEWRDRWTIEIDLLAGDALGLWHETTTGARGADLVSLFAWLGDVKYGRALHELARILGCDLPQRKRHAP